MWPEIIIATPLRNTRTDHISYCRPSEIVEMALAQLSILAGLCPELVGISDPIFSAFIGEHIGCQFFAVLHAFPLLVEYFFQLIIKVNCSPP